METTKIIQSVMSRAGEYVNKYTYPVFIYDVKNKPDLIASSVIIKIDEKCYLVTAAHVLKNIQRHFYIGVNGYIIPIEGLFVYSMPPTDNHNDKDHFDIAFIELSSEFVNLNKICVLDEHKLAISESFSSIDIALIHGFPISRNKKQRKTPPFKAKPYSYGGIIKNDFDEWDDFGKSKLIHTCMIYNKKKDNNRPVHPRGISGGGLWIIPSVFNPNDIYLESIFIEYHQKNNHVTFSTKINHVVDFIRQNT